ncbi:hypothetical protein BDFB_002008 [Asbolus verrucosus]|uniref:Uncharacterized protein n=1 Tax=Asbolus verrucosus TaxID=1661398 RepID=A0A482VKW4_ASBVE|nr:hypothetical protein BDFB_002008 [Asbolus verrucosus]
MVTPRPCEFPTISEVLRKGQRIKNLRAIGRLTTNWKKIGESPHFRMFGAERRQCFNRQCDM